MADGPVVSVRGEAVLEVEPEIARFTAWLAARDRDRDHALASLQRRSGELLALLRSFGDVVERTETASMRVQPQFKDGRPNEKVIGYTAAMTIAVTVRDIDRLGEVVTAVASEELVTLTGPAWALRPNSDVYRQARVAAAHDAVRRAAQYAAAVGSTISGLLEFADVGLLGDTPRPGTAPPRAMAAPMAAGAAPEAGFDLEPARQVVRASVDARFVMTPPVLDLPSV